MIDINLIRENSKLVEQNIKKKGQDFKLPLVSKAKDLDENWRKLKIEADKLRAERNTISKEISETKKMGGKTDILMKRAKDLPEEISKTESKMSLLEQDLSDTMKKIPNIISKHVPSGKDASQNVEIKKGGKIKKFSFAPKTHVELTESLGIADFDASSRVSGNGFYYLK